jgi:hypothetical protein
MPKYIKFFFAKTTEKNPEKIRVNNEGLKVKVTEAFIELLVQKSFFF